MPHSLQHLANRLTFRQLQVFSAVYELRSYSKAGEQLGLTQPAVSSQIRQIEAAIGMPLFEYIGRRLFSTAAGEHFARSVQHILDEVGRLQNDMAALQGKVVGELRLVAVNTAQYIIPYLLRAFLALYPQVKISVRVVNRAAAVKRLAANRDDLVIMGMVPTDKPLASLPFLDNELIAVVPPEHPLLSQRHVSAQMFFDSHLITRESGSGSRLALEVHCQRQRIQMVPSLELGSNELVKHAVIAGLGVAVVPKLSVLSELKEGLMVELPLPEFPLRRSWCLVYPSAKQPTPPMRAFIDYVQQNIRTFEQLFHKDSA